MDGENRYHAIFGGGPCYIVHPSDTAPMLVALDASVRIVGPGGGRRIPLEVFFAAGPNLEARTSSTGDLAHRRVASAAGGRLVELVP